MEVSALKYSGGGGLHGRSPLLRLQSDERLVTLIRRGNGAAFELLVSRYNSRLLAFCRHLLNSREDAEDVLQEVFTASYNAMLADDRPINVRPWLYRIARNRCLNQLRRAQAIGVDTMDVHFSDHGASTADKVNDREEFRMLLGDIQGLPESQRTALILREMDALSYEQIAEAMETTVSSVKSLLVRARVSLAEASESRQLTCEEVRTELAEVAEGLIKKSSPAVRRHVKSCSRCDVFEGEMKRSSKALAALMPLGALAAFRKLLFLHLGHSAGTGAASAASAAGASGAGAAGAGASAASVAAGAGASSTSLIGAGVGAVATKAAAGLAAAALVTAGTVAVSTQAKHHHRHGLTGLQVLTTSVTAGVAHSTAAAAHLAAPLQSATSRASTPPTSHHGGPVISAHAARAPQVKAAAAVVLTTAQTTVLPSTTATTATTASVTTTTAPLTTTPATTPITVSPTPTTTSTTTATTPSSATGGVGIPVTTTTPTTTTPATTTTITTATTTPTTTTTPVTTTPATTTTTTTATPTSTTPSADNPAAVVTTTTASGSSTTPSSDS